MESHASVGKIQRVAAIFSSAMLMALGATSSASAAEDAQTHSMRDHVFGQDDPNAAATLPSEQVRQELLAARERAWRFVLSFQNDPAAVERIYASEFIAVEAASETLEDRFGLTFVAESMRQRGDQLLRLKFPRTDIRLYGDTAILYYTYIMERRLGGEKVIDSGRGTEIFVRRNDRWLDAGRHLDNGPFARHEGAWYRRQPPDLSFAPIEDQR
jgi:Domain of unknown function (DUF4440)